MSNPQKNPTRAATWAGVMVAGAWLTMFAAGCSCDNKVRDGSDGGDGGNTDSGVTTCTTPEECGSGKTCSNGVCVPDSCPGSDTPGCNCEAGCNGSVVGPGGTAFTPTPDNSSEVELDPNGFLVLKTRELPKLPYIWIVNTGEGSVSKFSTEEKNSNGTFKELGRYRTGGISGLGGLIDDYQKTANDPSRTTVNVIGDAFVGNRRGRSVTKFAGSLSRCRDMNADGVINGADTSIDANNNGTIDPAEIKPWNQDGCMLWHYELPVNADSSPRTDTLVRAMASQDLPLPDGGWGHFVWVGVYGRKAFLLRDNGESVQRIAEITTPVRPYGFALDRNEQLWIASYQDAGNDDGVPNLGRIDTKRCGPYQATAEGTLTPEGASACSIAACIGEGVSGDDCVTQRINARASGTAASFVYGITVDKNQKIWLGGSNVYSYDHTAAPGERWKTAATGNTMGIAADNRGFIYGGGRGSGLRVIEAATFPAPGSFTTVAGTSGDVYGLAVDVDDKIWGIHIGDNDVDGSSNAVTDEYATVVDPKPVANGPALDPGTTTFKDYHFNVHARLDGSGSLLALANADRKKSAPNLAYPYTYSDMTGVQYRLATGRLGAYNRTFEACADQPGTTATWQGLLWDVATPPGTHLRWYVRAYSDPATKPEFREVGYVYTGTPPDSTAGASLMSPQDLTALLGAEANGRYLDVRVNLVVHDTDASVLTPTIKSFEATHSCVRLTE
jgi:hypothetical protein